MPARSSSPAVHDVLIVGGGLSGSLAAWRLATERQDLSLCVIESGATLGGSHTWSFHDTDLASGALRWLEPLVVARWPKHEVRFPGHRRLLSGGYRSITSERLHAVIAPVLGARARFAAAVASTAPDGATLQTGERISARLVIDARGPRGVGLQCGWQTFMGRELELAEPHGLGWPLLMDATVAQHGGFRFVYVLPFGERRVLVEDTLYADDPAIDADDRRARIARYAAERGWHVRSVVREEQGALPIPLSGAGDAFWRDEVIRIGAGAGLFHPTTGYSLSDAVTTAELLVQLAGRPPLDVYNAVRRVAERRWSQRGYFRMLNRLLFRAAAPESRVGVLEQFYRRSEPLIARFYGDRLTWVDRCRLLAGVPPVPVGKAITQLLPQTS
jgi:lycopene beta-cyclase